MKLLDAAKRALAESPEGRPMHYKRITEIAQAEGWISPRGLTPEASMNAALTVHIAKSFEAGEEPVVTAHGRGYYSLTRSKSGTAVEDAVRRHNETVREQLHSELREMDPRAFEEVIGRLLEALGFDDVEVTNYTGDSGIDVRGTLSVGGVTNVRTAIQVKRTSASVGAPLVQQLRGSLSTHERGLIITVGRFSQQAKAEAVLPDRPPISLVDGTALVELLVENQIGVTASTLRMLRLDMAALLPTEDVAEAMPDEAAATPPQPLSGRSTGTPARSGRRPDGKLTSLWPLPGGQDAYVRTITEMLRFVAENNPTLEEFLAWMMATYPTVQSRKTAIGYLNVPRFAGLVEPQADRFALTADAAAYLASNDADDLLAIMSTRIAGLEETLDFVGESPRTVTDVTTHLNGVLGTDWESDAQAGWRLKWLENFGKVKRDGQTWVASAPMPARPSATP
jgi:HJR/Mrr/RecB family endonuclease